MSVTRSKRPWPSTSVKRQEAAPSRFIVLRLGAGRQSRLASQDCSLTKKWGSISSVNGWLMVSQQLASASEDVNSKLTPLLASDRPLAIPSAMRRIGAPNPSAWANHSSSWIVGTHLHSPSPAPR